LRHFASPRFWELYRTLPTEAQELAPQKLHPTQVGRTPSVLAPQAYRQTLVRSSRRPLPRARHRRTGRHPLGVDRDTRGLRQDHWVDRRRPNQRLQRTRSALVNRARHSPGAAQPPAVGWGEGTPMEIHSTDGARFELAIDRLEEGNTIVFRGFGFSIGSTVEVRVPCSWAPENVTAGGLGDQGPPPTSLFVGARERYRGPCTRRHQPCRGSFPRVRRQL